jgi:hypothetical protein
MYLLPLTNVESLTKIIRKFFWEGNSEKKKNTIWLSGIWFVNQGRKVDWE